MLRCPRSARINHLWRECRIGGNDAQQWGRICLHGNAVLGSGQQGGAIETLQNWMRLLDARVTVSLRADDLACGVNCEHIGQLKVGTRFAPFVVTGGFKRSEKRTASTNVLPNSFTLSIAEVSCIGKKNGAIFFQIRRVEISFVYEVEYKTAFQQRVVKSLQIIDRSTAIARASGFWAGIESNGALRIQDGQIGNRKTPPILVLCRLSDEVLTIKIKGCGFFRGLLTRVGKLAVKPKRGILVCFRRYLHSHLFSPFLFTNGHGRAPQVRSGGIRRSP